MTRLISAALVGCIIACAVSVATSGATVSEFWHHTVGDTVVCNDSQTMVGELGEARWILVPNLADAGPFETKAECEAWTPPAPVVTAAPAAVPQPPDHYQWCNSQQEAAPFSLSLAESLTLSSNWYRPFMISGSLTCATDGLTPTVGVFSSVGGELFNQQQYDAMKAYWGVAPLYQVATS